MDTTYKGHWISSFSRQNPDNDRWLVEIDVFSPQAGGGKNQRFEGPLEGFPSQPEAELWGIQVAKKWIDAGKPNPGN